MTLLPTALEEAAKAISISTGDEPDKLTYAREMQCSGADREPQYRWQYWTEHATAAITAYLAQMEKEGWVMVPKDATDQMAVAGGIDCENVIFGGAGDYPTIFDAMKKVYGTMIANRPLAAAQNGGE